MKGKKVVLVVVCCCCMVLVVFMLGLFSVIFCRLLYVFEKRAV